MIMYFAMIGWTSLILVTLLSPIPTLAGLGLAATKAGTTYGGLAKEIAALGVYGSERAVIVVNNGHVWLRIWCASRDDSTGEKHLNPGEYIAFKFKPLVMGGYTVFWCTTDYKHYWARWDVFGDAAGYGGNNRNDREYVYEIRDDGIYYKGMKIRGLASGRYPYTLWDNYDNDKRPHGTSLKGYVDSGMCNNVPGFMEWKTSSVTLCDYSCVILYSNLHCSGETSRLQASGGCSDFWLSYFNDRTRSLKGC